MEALSLVQTDVLSALVRGLSVSTAARAHGVHRSTVHNWLKSDPNFVHAYEAIQRDRALVLSDCVEELQGTALRTLQDLLADPHTPTPIRLRTALAVLQQHPVNAPNTHPSAALKEFVPAKPDVPPPQPQIARNAPCPCGSGEKYKRCCGKSAPPVLNTPAFDTIRQNSTLRTEIPINGPRAACSGSPQSSTPPPRE